MSYGQPNPPAFLPPPLHRIPGKGREYNAHRILYKEKPTDDWLIWRCVNIETLRDGVFWQEVEKYPDIKFARQSFELPINPEDL